MWPASGTESRRRDSNSLSRQSSGSSLSDTSFLSSGSRDVESGEDSWDGQYEKEGLGGRGEGGRRRSIRTHGVELVSTIRTSLSQTRTLPCPRLARSLYSICLILLGLCIGSNYPTYLTIYTRRPAGYQPLLPPSLPPLPPAPLQLPTPGLPAPLDPIPNILHYVYGLAEQTEDFPYFAYLAMRSAMTTLQPDRVMFHCVHEPKGYWWDRILEFRMEASAGAAGTTGGLVEVTPARDVESIGADERPVSHYAHKADILRIEVLLEHGGIYLDIDTYVLRPFALHGLMQQDVVLAMEARPLEKEILYDGVGADDGMHPKGLCNAIIMARPGAEFLKRWMTTYEQGYDADEWEWNSVKMPWILAKLYPTLLTILSDRAFFWPLYTQDHFNEVYETTGYDFASSGQLAYHAWESRAKAYLPSLTPDRVRTTDTSFTRMVRTFQAADEEANWRAWIGGDTVAGAKQSNSFWTRPIGSLYNLHQTWGM